MVEFTHYFIYGNPPEGFTMEKMEEWLKVPTLTQTIKDNQKIAKAV